MNLRALSLKITHEFQYVVKTVNVERGGCWFGWGRSENAIHIPYRKMGNS